MAKRIDDTARTAALETVGEFSRVLGFALENLVSGEFKSAAQDFAGAEQLAIDAGVRADALSVPCGARAVLKPATIDVITAALEAALKGA